jgi:hypothetical protein
MESIAAAATPKLTNLTFSATQVFRRLTHSHWVHIYSQLTVLEVNLTKFREPVDLLRHCSRLEALKLSGVHVHRLSPEDELPFLQTLRHLWLKGTSIQWMAGQIFHRVESCTLLTPTDPHSIPPTSTINLPLCTRIIFESHLVSILAAFRAPAVQTINIECNQWSKALANIELGRVWSQRWDRRMLQPKVLSLNIFCGQQPLLEALQQMSSLEELVLKLPHPSALGVGFFEALCGVPMNRCTGRTREEWHKWANGETKWQARVCPSLVNLQLQYKRWLRKGEMDAVTPLFIALAWSLRKLHLPLQHFGLKLGGDDPIQLKGMTYWDLAFRSLWQHTAFTSEEAETLYTDSLTTVVNRSIGFVNGTNAFPIEALGKQYYCSFFRRLRAFHHHSAAYPRDSYNLLPFFEHLEELDVSNFRFEPCPSAVSLPLCWTLRILHLRNTPLDWMDGRVFKQVIECRIILRKDWHVRKLGRVEMPTCKKMEFARSDHLETLASFHLPSLGELRLDLSPKGKALNRLSLVRDLIRSIHPQVLQIRVKPEDESLVTTLKSYISKDIELKFT